MASVDIENLQGNVRQILDGIRGALKSDERLRSVSISGSVVFSSQDSVPVGSSQTEPLGQSVTVAEEEVSTTSQESTQSEQSLVQNGGDRISASESTQRSDN